MWMSGKQFQSLMDSTKYELLNCSVFDGGTLKHSELFKVYLSTKLEV